MNTRTDTANGDERHGVTRRATLVGGASLAAAATLRARFNADAQGAPESAATAPMMGFDVYLADLHVSREDPRYQMPAHHYCRRTPEGIYHCALFDGNTADSRLIGHEHIIDDAFFQTLPPWERPYWHPHNYPILSGQLVAPTLSSDAELELMRNNFMNSYGRNWHGYWRGGYNRQGRPPDQYPRGFGQPGYGRPGYGMPGYGTPGYGTPGWSFNRDGQVNQGLLESYNVELKIDQTKKRKEREVLVPDARPQEGVNDLTGLFPNESSTMLPGVEEAAPSAEGTPTA